MTGLQEVRKVKPTTLPFKCPNCNGYGTVGYDKRECHSCDGKGIVYVPQIPIDEKEDIDA